MKDKRLVKFLDKNRICGGEVEEALYEEIEISNSELDHKIPWELVD